MTVARPWHWRFLIRCITIRFMNPKNLFLAAILLAFCVVMLNQAQTPPANRPNNDLGYTDTPMLPGLPWHVHDPDRPHPAVITPATQPGGPPSDAIVLFDGTDLARWE